jgi:serine phosphatase RsbU (regulator of sigma subunit)
LTGQTVSGDLHVVTPFPAGVLVGVIDGLGHGTEAAAAAKIAVATLTSYAHEPIVTLLKRCHEQLRGTRGVAMSLASFTAQDSSLTWVGVGNVEGVLWRANRNVQPPQEAIPLRGGVVGYQLPPLRVTVHSVARGDILIFATDGIRSGFAREPLSGPLLQQRPQFLADRFLAQYGKNTDDALVLVARYLGGAS